MPKLIIAKSIPYVYDDNMVSSANILVNIVFKGNENFVFADCEN